MQHVFLIHTDHDIYQTKHFKNIIYCQREIRLIHTFNYVKLKIFKKLYFFNYIFGRKLY